MENSLTDLLPQIASDRRILIDVLIAILILAVVVMIMVELVKFALKPYFQMRVLRGWENQLICRRKRENRVLPPPERTRHSEGDRPFKVPEGNIVELYSDVYRLPRRLFMQQVENKVQQLLAEPGREPERVRILAAEAAESDVAAYVSWSDPDQKSGSSEKPEKTWDEIRDRVTTAAQLNVDVLQVTLATKWLFYVRILSVYLGILSASTLLLLVPGPFEWKRAMLLIVIGLVAGVAASLIHDLLRRLTGGDRDRY